jgi:hypothetical protein
MRIRYSDLESDGMDRVSDPDTDPDPEFFLIADPDPGFDDLKLKKN